MYMELGLSPLKHQKKMTVENMKNYYGLISVFTTKEQIIMSINLGKTCHGIVSPLIFSPALLIPEAGNY